MAQLLQNNLSGVLASGINTAAASMTLVDAANWPAPTGGDYYLVTLIGLNGNGQESLWEIVKVTAKASNTLTIVRAQESTSAASWPAATTVQMRLTAGSVIPGNVAKAGDTMTGALTATGFAGPLNGTVGATTPAAGSFTTLAASSNVTLSGGTANGVLYLNGSKVATSGSALTYNGSALSLYSTVAGLSIQTALSTNQATITLADVDGRTAVFRSPSGGASNVAQIGTTTNHDVAFLQNNAEQMRLNSSGLEAKGKLLVGYSDFSGLPTNGAAFAGSVGIGTSSPAYKLQVDGASTAGFVTSIVAKNPSTNAASAVKIGFDGGGTIWGEIGASYNTNDPYMAFFVRAGSEKMRITDSGNLGLGVVPSAWWATAKAVELVNGVSLWANVSTPACVLTSNAFVNSSVQWIYKTSTQATYYQQYQGQHQWFRSTDPTPTAEAVISFTQAMTLDANGSLVIGGTNALNSLTKVTLTDGTITSVYGYFTGGVAYEGTISNHPLAFLTNNSERARITSGGDLLVGTQSDYLASRVLVKTTTTDNSTNALTLQNSASTDLLRIRSDGYTYAGFYAQTTGNAANVFIGTLGELLRSTSSLKYKTDVQNATHGLAEVMQLRPVTYKGKNDGDKIFGGLIAEEVDAVGLTEFVQYAEDGSPDALAYGNMVSVLVKAIQEQQALINSLTARVAALESN